jgi:uncharacterized phiE125 gp8 family phage protein
LLTLSPINLTRAPIVASPLPVGLTLLKQALNVTYTDRDDLIEMFLVAALGEFEGDTKRTVLRRSHRWTLKCFPTADYGVIRLPGGWTRKVNSVQYAEGDDEVTLYGVSAEQGSPPVAQYREDLTAEDGGIIMPLRGSQWPDVEHDDPNPVVITFEAGYSAAELPADIKSALAFRVQKKFDDDRGATAPSMMPYNEQAFERMCAPFRLYRTY